MSLEPFCIFAPENAQEVASAVSFMVTTRTQFAVRGHGHMMVKGAASTNQGVLIVFSRMKRLQLSPDRQMLSIEPGLNWLEVYDFTAPYNRAVVGGRYAPVGVSGLLLGGGISFYSGEYGWGANSVKNYQVVSADGQIIEANGTSHTDLFWALKGGSSNFGVVTRFDLETHPGHLVSAGTLTYDVSNTPQFLKGLGAYVSHGGINDPTSAILPNIFIDPPSGDVTAAVFAFSNRNNTSSLREFTQMKTTTNTISLRPFKDFIEETVGPSADRTSRSVLPSNEHLVKPPADLRRSVFHSISFKAKAESITLMFETIKEMALQELKSIPGSQVALSIQPIGVSWLQAARAAGGDAIDLDPADGNLIGKEVDGITTGRHC